LWHPSIDQSHKQHALFLLVMASIGEALDEVRRIDEEAGAHCLASPEAVGRRLETGQDALDDPMLVH